MIPKKILTGIVNFPRKVTGPMKDLIKDLLTKDHTRRLGVLKGGKKMSRGIAFTLALGLIEVDC